MIAEDNETRARAAAPTFTSGMKDITIKDNYPAEFRWDRLTAIVNLSSPLTVRISPFDVEGNAIAGYVGVVTLSVVLPDGSTRPVTPPTANFSNGAWSGSLTLPQLNVSPLRLRVQNSAGTVSDTPPFEIMRVIPLSTTDLVGNESRNLIYASVKASDAGTVRG